MMEIAGLQMPSSVTVPPPYELEQVYMFVTNRLQLTFRHDCDFLAYR